MQASQKTHVLQQAQGMGPMATGVHFVANQKHSGHHPTFVGRVAWHGKI